jgi:hypothetical protein
MREDITLTPSRSKHLLFLMVSAVFTAIGVMVLSRGRSDSFDVWMAWLCIVFFGLCGLVFLVQFFPGSSFLRIRREGFEFRALWRGATFRWSDVEEFGVAEFTVYHSGIPQKHRMVGFRLSPSYPRRDKLPRLRRLNEKLMGYEAALPDNYGMKHEELAALLNRKKAEYGG